MRTCKLIRITCHKENEYVSDEPYIVVRGKRVWSAEGVDEGESREINLEFRFTRALRVRLYEEDRGRGAWFDPDDFIDEHIIRPVHAGKGELEFHFIGEGAHYSIRMVVTNLRGENA